MAVVAHPVGAEIIVVGVEGDGRRELPGQRRRGAPALVVDIVAARRVTGVIEAVDPQRGTFAELVIRVHRAAEHVRRAAGQLADQEIVAGLRLLGFEPDRAAGGAAAEKRARGALDDLDLLDGEDLAAGDAGIALAVDIDVVTGFEAADEDAVAEGVAALPGAERDAGRGAGELAEAGRALVLNHFLGNDGDRLGRVAQRLGEAPVGRLVHLVRRLAVGVGVRVRGAFAVDDDLGPGGGGFLRLGDGRQECAAESGSEQGGGGRRGAQAGIFDSFPHGAAAIATHSQRVKR